MIQLKLKPLAEKIVRLTSMSVGTYLAWYFAGPLVGELGRYAFESYYHLVYGTPSAASLAYWFEYLPLRGHATNAAFLWGNTACIALAAPLFYKLPDLLLSYSSFSSLKGKRQINLSNATKRPELTEQFLDKYEFITCQLDENEHSMNGSTFFEQAKTVISSKPKKDVVDEGALKREETRKNTLLRS